MKLYNKIFILKYQYLFLMIIFSGGAISFFKQNAAWVLILFFSFLVQFKYSLPLLKKSKIAILIFSIYFIITSIVFNAIHPFFFIKYVTLIIIANHLNLLFGKHIYCLYEAIVYKLGVLSLILFTLEITSTGFFSALASIIDLNDGLSSNFLIYTVHFRSVIDPRNCGFTWEPGPFSAFIAVAFFIYLISNQNYNNFKIITYSLILLTTKSELGLSLLLILILFFVVKNSKLYVKFIALIFSVFFVFIFGVFKGFEEKIDIELNDFNNSDITTKYLSSEGVKGHGRLLSLVYAWENFKMYPVHGFAGHKKAEYSEVYNFTNINFSSGFIDLIGRFGLFGLVAFIYLLNQSGQFLAFNFNKNNIRLVWSILILFVTTSISLIFSPILFTFLFFPNSLTPKLN